MVCFMLGYKAEPNVVHSSPISSVSIVRQYSILAYGPVLTWTKPNDSPPCAHLPSTVCAPIPFDAHCGETVVVQILHRWGQMQLARCLTSDQRSKRTPRDLSMWSAVALPIHVAGRSELPCPNRQDGYLQVPRRSMRRMCETYRALGEIQWLQFVHERFSFDLTLSGIPFEVVVLVRSVMSLTCMATICLAHSLFRAPCRRMRSPSRHAYHGSSSFHLLPLLRIRFHYSMIRIDEDAIGREPPPR